MKFIKITYLFLSGLSFLLVCGFLIIFFLSFTQVGMSYSHDPVFTLNHGNIVTEQEYLVIYSHQSPPVFNGDHLDYYCVQIEKFEFQNPKVGEWLFGREENPIFSKARKQAAMLGNMDECFKGEIDAESNNIAAKIWSVDTNRKHIEGLVVIMYHKNSNRVLYVSSQT
jgi:hypothetical protein